MSQLTYEELPGHLMVIMRKLLTPDNSIIQEATQELRLLFKHHALVMALATVISACPEVQIRQFAAVLMRRKVTKQWKNLPSEFQASLKTAIFQMMKDEQEHIVRVALAQVCAAVAKRELPYNKWDQFYQNLNVCLKSGNVKDREIGSIVLSSVSVSAAECMRPHFKGLFNLFSVLLDDAESKMVPYYTIKAMTSLVTSIGTDEVPLFRALIPKVIAVTKKLLVTDEDQGCEAMELFDELVECEVSIIVPHIKEIVVFSLEVSSNSNFGGNARVKALSFIACLGRMKKKAILKQKLVGPILKAIFPIMAATPEEDEEEEEIGEDAESSHPASYGAQVIDILALHLPPEKLFPPLMQMVRPALENQDPYHRKAGLICIAVLAEGCADYIRNKHLEVMLQYICKGMDDGSQVVHNAALFALGQFSEHLQPDISKYHSHILPLLFTYLGRASETADQDPAGITRTYYALEMFCENLGDELLPYLPALMDKLLHSLQTSKGVHTRELAISAIGATANAAKENMCPYFLQIMEQLRGYLLASDMGSALVLKIQAVDTLGVLARTIGAENFVPLVDESIQLGLQLINDINDPDLRRCTYGLFASISSVIKEGMAPHLETIVKLMIDSLQSTEGVVAHFKEDENEMLQVFGEDDADVDEEEDISIEEDEEEEEDIEGYSVENAYLEEKEDACNALAEIADNSSLAFLPHIDECFSEIMKLIEYPASNIRKAALCCMGTICRVLSRAQGSIDNGGEVFAKAMEKVIPCFINVINTDSERTVVMAALETINEMLKEGSRAMVSEQSHVTSITSAIRNVLQLKTACQDEDDEEDYEEDPQQAEHDEMLIEYAGEIIPSLAKAMGGQAFGPYLAGALPLLVMKTKKTCTVAEKSFSIGTLSETVIAMEDCIQPFAGHLVPVFVQGMQEDDPEVRSNAVFGIGVLAEHGKETVFSHYPVILSAVSSLIGKEDDQRVIDNICGAVSRLVLTNTDAVPVSQVIPRLVQLLPLKEDLEENNTVFRCIHHLYGCGHETIPPLIPQLIMIFAQVLGTTQINEVTHGLIVQIIQSVHNQNPDDFSKLLSSLPEDLASTLSSVVCSL